MLPAEPNYDADNTKLLAIVEAFKIWHHYLKGTKHIILLVTDHNNLKKFKKITCLSGRQIR